MLDELTALHTEMGGTPDAAPVQVPDGGAETAPVIHAVQRQK